ncbi:MAG: hypothetical protein ACLP1X_10560 [Polyangiaceae bacterium]
MRAWLDEVLSHPDRMRVWLDEMRAWLRRICGELAAPTALCRYPQARAQARARIPRW